MPSTTRTCPSCATPLSGHAPGCEACGDDAAALERVRRALADRYAIERAVGEGGTATVYLARDIRHRREVAVKVLRPEIASLVGSARFLREIEIAAQLQHPHILPVYDSGEASAEGERLLFYVMPLAAESLAARIARGGMPLGDAVRVLSQVADALAFAHAAGVVHRDIKPDNVMLAGRHAMVADFGIAKALTLPITGSPKTRPGVALGTPYYMAPEQVAGEPEVDGRADQYALGVVAYELLTGHRPFTGETVQEILAAQVLDGAEPIERLRPDLPPGLAQAVMRALAKVPEERCASTEELATRLESFALALGSTTPPDSALERQGPRRPRRWASALGTGALAAGALAVGAFAASLVLPGRAAPLAAAMSEQVSFSGTVGVAAVSPDGRLLAWSSLDDAALLIQEISGGEPHQIARGFTDVLALRWSPDGGDLLVGGRYEGEPGMYVLPRLGGAPRRLARARLGQWHPSGNRVSMWDYADRAVRLVDLDTGDSTRVPLPGAYDWLYSAEWSPSGARLAYVTMREPNHYALRVTSPDATAGGLLVEDTMPLGSPRWAPGEDALYYLSGSAELWKVKLAGRGPGPRGDPVLLQDGLQAAPSEVAAVAVPFTLTADGRRLLYLKGLDYSNLWLVGGLGGPKGRTVSTHRLTSGTAQRRGVSISPDGKWIAYLETSKEGTDLYRMPTGGGTATRVTHTGRVASRQTAWSPDGRRLAVGMSDGGSVRLATVEVDGGQVVLYRGSHLPAMGDLAWSPGSHILYQVAGNRNFMAMNPADGTERPLLPDPEVGWMFAALPAPGGERVAAYWNRRPIGGVWLLSVRDTGRRLLRATRADPIGWSADARSVLTLGWDSSEVVRSGLDGRTEELGKLPFRDPSCISAEAAQRGALVCAVPERVSDVWMVDGFDPELR